MSEGISDDKLNNGTDNNTSENTDVPKDATITTIKDITEEYGIKAEKPRSEVYATLITVLFILGPMALLFNTLIPKWFAGLPIDGNIIFGAITGIFVLLSIITAWKK